ncbi:hypothetical protein GH714_026900 [Hevea brasiliensis]|uniref:Uncharacterized protein n=1 Tax=Hevea brasiliensis TaxID=3981 RepID=A0A6A6L0N4_HEVBR|nr:hypothetical protein GH714_026900 [Hevea brasiliensis]
MEGGKGVEAGPSTAGVVSETQERQKKMTEKAPAETVIDDGEEEEDNGIPCWFCTGPLLSSRNRLKRQVDQSKGMLGTFAPQQEPYKHTLEEETTPSGVLARGIYSAKLKAERSAPSIKFYPSIPGLELRIVEKEKKIRRKSRIFATKKAQGCAYEKLLEKISYARVTTRCTEGKLSADESRYGASSQKEEPEMIS